MKFQPKNGMAVVGIIAKIMTESGIKQLVRLFDHKCGISQRKAARNMKCTQSIINWALKNKFSIRLIKKTKISKRTSAQKDKICRFCYDS